MSDYLEDPVIMAIESAIEAALKAGDQGAANSLALIHSDRIATLGATP